jgi:hypothetical protein
MLVILLMPRCLFENHSGDFKIIHVTYHSKGAWLVSNVHDMSPVPNKYIIRCEQCSYSIHMNSNMQLRMYTRGDKLKQN